MGPPGQPPRTATDVFLECGCSDISSFFNEGRVIVAHRNLPLLEGLQRELMVMMEQVKLYWCVVVNLK